MRAALAAGLLCLTALEGMAEGLDLDGPGRAAFGAEIRDLLLDEPEIVARALDMARPDPGEIYAEEAADDRSRIAEVAPLLFSATKRGFGAAYPRLTVALFIAADCPECRDAVKDLVALTQSHPGLRVELRPLRDDHATLSLLQGVELFGPESLLRRNTVRGTRPPLDTVRLLAEAESAAWLGLDTAPSYVFPDMMIRGHVPSAVLERYIGRE